MPAIIAMGVVAAAGAIQGGIAGNKAAQAQERLIDNQMKAMWMEQLSNAGPRSIGAVSGQRMAISSDINQSRSEQAKRVLDANAGMAAATAQANQATFDAATGVAAAAVGTAGGLKQQALAKSQHAELMATKTGGTELTKNPLKGQYQIDSGGGEMYEGFA